MKRICPGCRAKSPEKGRGLDGRRAYRCTACSTQWTEGLQGRKRKYSIQRQGMQFKDTGALKNPYGDMTVNQFMHELKFNQMCEDMKCI